MSQDQAQTQTLDLTPVSLESMIQAMQARREERKAQDRKIEEEQRQTYYNGFVTGLSRKLALNPDQLFETLPELKIVQVPNSRRNVRAEFTWAGRRVCISMYEFGQYGEKRRWDVEQDGVPIGSASGDSSPDNLLELIEQIGFGEFDANVQAELKRRADGVDED